MSDVRLVLCDECGSEGRIYRGRDETDYGPCPACDGTGKALIEVASIELDDLEEMHEALSVGTENRRNDTSSQGTETK